MYWGFLPRGAVAAALAVALSGCVMATGEVVIPRLPDAEIHHANADGFDAARYRSVLVILPDTRDPASASMAGGAKEKASGTAPVEKDSPGADPHPTLTLSRAADYDFIVNEAERCLLENGFQIISQDVISKIDTVTSKRFRKESHTVRYTAPETALLLGKKTNADALLVLSHVGAWPSEQYFLFDDDEWKFKARPMPQDAEGLWITYPLWEVTLEAKLVDIKTGEIVWMGSGRYHSRNLFAEDWRGVVSVRAGETWLESENFRIEDFNTYDSLYRQASFLVKKVLSGLGPQAQARR
ncbi:MAG: DUF799 domain-containing protein [Deltaproteobacteria bacterium]|nr:DUF799 domain-containing protein [Deltaproteobacteria bacterium]